MKKIILLFLLLTFLQVNAQGVFEQYQNMMEPYYSHNKITTGQYFDGCAWIFFPWGGLFTRYRMQYSKIRINPDGTTEMLTDDSDGDYLFDFPFDVEDSKTGATAIVFKQRLYLFWTNDSDRVKYTSTDGTTWSDPAYASDITAGGKNMATTVVNNKIFLLKQNINGGIKLFSTPDCETWTSRQIVYTNSDNIPISSLGLASFITSDAKPHLLIAINRMGDYIETYWWDAANGLYNNTGMSGAQGNGVSLVTGRANFSGDYKWLPIQCIIHGTDGKLWIAHFNPGDEDNQWLGLQVVPHVAGPIIQVPSAFSNFRFRTDGSVEKQVWVSFYQWDGMGIDWLGVYRVASERLKKTETANTSCDSLPSLWSLIGVVEGPPPYVLNGQNITDLDDPPSVFTYGTTQSTEVVNSSDWKISTSTSLSVPILDGIFSCGLDLEAALNDNTSTSYSSTYTVLRSVEAGEYSLGYYYFEVPTITRYKYNSYLMDDTPTGEYEYIYSITGSAPHTVAFDSLCFNPNDITTYLNKVPDQHYPRISGHAFPFEWLAQAPFESEFTQGTTYEETEGSSLSIGGNVGIAEIFNVGANYETSISTTHTTSFGESIRIAIDCPNPRSGHTEDIEAFYGNAYWLKAPDSNAFWIPKNFKIDPQSQGHNFSDQRPWCVTWAVTEIDSNDLNGVDNSDNLPDKFNLSQNYPNPFSAKNGSTTTINYSIPSVRLGRIAKSGPAWETNELSVELKVYDILGREVATLVNKNQTPGKYSVQFDAGKLSSGIYFYTLRAGDFTATKKMILIR